jgi:hypothetical protein
MASDEEEPPEPRSLLGLPRRLVRAVGSVVIPAAAIGLFSVLHDWAPPPVCGAFDVFGCPSTGPPLGVRAVDWLYLIGPALGLASAIAAFRMSKDPAEAGVFFNRYVIPVIGLIVSIWAAVQLGAWVALAAR